MGIEETARLAGHSRWCELQLFEALGRFAVTSPEPAVKVLLGAHCGLHSWHAELWHERMPEIRATGSDQLTRPASHALAGVVASVIAPEAPELSIERLVGVYRVFLPRLVAAYTNHLEVVRGSTDQPTERVLRLVIRDELEQWHEGEMMIQSLVRSPDHVRRATDRQREIEARMVAAGGVTVPDPGPALERADTG